MTKVEELRGHIVDMADGVSFSEITCFLGLLDSYAAVSHAEGVAEGERDKGLQGSNFRKVANLLSEANAKLVTARAEGVAEGEEQERERIVAVGSRGLVLHDGDLLVGGVPELRKKFSTEGYVYIVAASALAPNVLAPTKEVAG